MARSMTGFARTTVAVGEQQFTLEISSVNHRYLECTFRLPTQWPLLEPALREEVKRHIARGKVYVSIRHARGADPGNSLVLDTDAVNSYLKAARILAQQMNTTEVLGLNTLMTLDGVMIPAEAGQDPEALQEQLCAALGQTLRALNEMRKKEGAALVLALEGHLDVISRSVSAIRARAPELQRAYGERMCARLSELNADIGIKEERLAMEMALMAERTDVTEELVRLDAHLAHARDVLSSREPVGRDLNFLSQEMLREINTLGSKLRDIETGRDVIEMKSELEKFREQVQNLE